VYSPNAKTKWLDAALTAGLALLVYVLYRKAVRLWWTYDDAYNLHLVIAHRLRDFFTSGEVWPQKLFTPLEMVAYRAELSAFGLAASRWYVLQLALVIASAVAVYAAARAWLAPLPAFVVGALYVAAVPMCSMATELSVVHYFVAITLGASAVAICGMRPQSGSMTAALQICSALLYLGAMLAKEIAIPLVILLILLTRRLNIPHVVALILYLLWRRAVLGTFFGGYGWAVAAAEWPSLLASLPKKLFLGMAGAGVWIGAISCLVLLAGALLALRGGRKTLLIVALLLAVGPIVPVSKEMQRRYVLMPWLALSFAFVAGANTLPRRARAALLIAAPLLAIVANRQEWRAEMPRLKRMSDEARVFWDLPPNVLLRAPSVPPAAMGELNWLKTEYAKHPAGTGWFYDDYYLCANDVGGKRAWQYDARTRRVTELPTPLDLLKRRACGSFRNDVPLTAEFHFRDQSLFWIFGPYRDGAWRVLLGDGLQAFDVPPRDGFQLGPLPGFALRIRYESPAGWVTYSPQIALDFVHRPDERWSRP
jgi:hypothetical protein